MRFAVLCDDPLARPVVEALGVEAGGSQLNYAVRMTPRSHELVGARNALALVNHWEDLLVAKELDVVLFGGSDPLMLEGAKQLATAGISLLFVPQAAQGSTFVYELSLIRDDNNVLLFPLLWHRFDAAVIAVKRALEEGRWGRVQFLQFQRTLSQPSTSTPVGQAVVDAELLNDTDLLRWLIGDYDQVTALRTAATEAGVLLQSVVLAGRSLPEANWSIAPIDGPGQSRLIIRAEQCVVELQRDESSRCWNCRIDGQRIEGDESSTARSALEAFAASNSHDRTGGTAQRGTVSSDWGELVKCFETVDATHRSIRRRRTIELHFEPMSERAIFKTQMTAIGCGLLMATLFLTLCFLGIASVLPLPPQVLVGLRILVFAPLVLFLLAQILLPLTRPSSNDKSQSPRG